MFVRPVAPVWWRWKFLTKDKRALVCVAVIGWQLACGAGVFWMSETLFVFVILFKPPSLILWQWKIGESRNSNPYGRCEGERRKRGRGRGVSTWRFREQITRSKKRPARQARWQFKNDAISIWQLIILLSYTHFIIIITCDKLHLHKVHFRPQIAGASRGARG